MHGSVDRSMMDMLLRQRDTQGKWKLKVMFFFFRPLRRALGLLSYFRVLSHLVFFCVFFFAARKLHSLLRPGSMTTSSGFSQTSDVVAWLTETLIGSATPQVRPDVLHCLAILYTAWCSDIGSLTSLMHVTRVHPVTTEIQFHCTRLY